MVVLTGPCNLGGGTPTPTPQPADWVFLGMSNYDDVCDVDEVCWWTVSVNPTDDTMDMVAYDDQDILHTSSKGWLTTEGIEDFASMTNDVALEIAGGIEGLDDQYGCPAGDVAMMTFYDKANMEHVFVDVNTGYNPSCSSTVPSSLFEIVYSVDEYYFDWLLHKEESAYLVDTY